MPISSFRVSSNFPDIISEYLMAVIVGSIKKMEKEYTEYFFY